MLEVTPRWLLDQHKAIASEGATALVHGNMYRRPAHRLKDERESRSSRWRIKYAGFNDQHFTEKPVVVEGIPASRSSGRRLLREARIGLGRKRRTSKHRRQGTQGTAGRGRASYSFGVAAVTIAGAANDVLGTGRSFFYRKDSGREKLGVRTLDSRPRLLSSMVDRDIMDGSYQ